MAWHIRYVDRGIKHEALSPELPTREAALDAAWDLAQGENDILAIEGPDEETVTEEEIGSWFDRRVADVTGAPGATEDVPGLEGKT